MGVEKMTEKEQEIWDYIHFNIEDRIGNIEMSLGNRLSELEKKVEPIDKQVQDLYFNKTIYYENKIAELEKDIKDIKTIQKEAINNLWKKSEKLEKGNVEEVIRLDKAFKQLNELNERWVKWAIEIGRNCAAISELKEQINDLEKGYLEDLSKIVADNQTDIRIIESVLSEYFESIVDGENYIEKLSGEKVAKKGKVGVRTQRESSKCPSTTKLGDDSKPDKPLLVAMEKTYDRLMEAGIDDFRDLKEMISKEKKSEPNDDFPICINMEGLQKFRKKIERESIAEFIEDINDCLDNTWKNYIRKKWQKRLDK